METFRSYVHLKNYRDYLPKEVADIIKCFEIALIRKECGHVVGKKIDKLMKAHYMTKFKRLSSFWDFKSLYPSLCIEIETRLNPFYYKNRYENSGFTDSTFMLPIIIKPSKEVTLDTRIPQSRNQKPKHHKIKFQNVHYPRKKNYIIHQPRK